MAKAKSGDEFSARTKRRLADRMGNVCSFPRCGRPTSGPSAEGNDATVNVGEACHIAAKSLGKNPSRFVSARRPVECVSWNHCLGFLNKLRERLPELAPRLPTEAEWEHACRAGRETATWVGDLQILGYNNAPLLDAIAWYGGNSGVGFELDEAQNSSGWLEKQHPHEKAGTHPVARKAPNPWGLYDMLGNVWEWCADWYDRHPSGATEDPTGPVEGSARVIHGGSWDTCARLVRAAYRISHDPRDRNDQLGFRLARGSGRGAR